MCNIKMKMIRITCSIKTLLAKNIYFGRFWHSVWDDAFIFYSYFTKNFFPLTFITVLAFVPVLAILAVFPWEAHPANRPWSTGSTGRPGRPGGAWQAACQLGTLLQRCLGKAPEDVVCHAGHGPEEEDSRDHGTACRNEMGSEVCGEQWVRAWQCPLCQDCVLWRLIEMERFLAGQGSCLFWRDANSRLLLREFSGSEQYFLFKLALLYTPIHDHPSFFLLSRLSHANIPGSSSSPLKSVCDCLSMCKEGLRQGQSPKCLWPLPQPSQTPSLLSSFTIPLLFALPFSEK